MKGKYKRNKGWCSSCDGEIVASGMKCSNCGTRENASKQKKPKIKTADFNQN